MEQIHEMIRFLRKQKGYTQEAIANKLGLSLRAYSKIENGETNLTINRLTELTSIFGVTLADLFNYADEKTSNKQKENSDDLKNDLEKEEYILQIKHYQEIIKLLKEHNETLRKLLAEK